MNIRKLKSNKSMVLVLVSAALLVFASVLCAENTCQVIQLTLDKSGGGSNINISPNKLSVPVGACTVWLNLVRDREVQVSFRENAKKCLASSKEATGFIDPKLDAGVDNLQLNKGEACYMTDKLTFGKTGSLIWSEPGTYKYTIEALPPVPVSGVGSDGKSILATGIVEVK